MLVTFVTLAAGCAGLIWLAWCNRGEPKTRVKSDTALKVFLAAVASTAASIICLGIAAMQQNIAGAALAACATVSCFLTGRRILARVAVQWEMENDEKAVVLVKLSDGEGTMTLRITENPAKEWPPLMLEVSNGRETLPGKDALMTLAEISRQGIFSQIDHKGKQNLKAALNHHGATHPIDIADADKDKDILKFLEDVLLGEMPERKA